MVTHEGMTVDRHTGSLALQAGGLPAVVWGGALRMCWVWHITWFVNSASHCWGYQVSLRPFGPGTQLEVGQLIGWAVGWFYGLVVPLLGLPGEQAPVMAGGTRTLGIGRAYAAAVAPPAAVP